jgi:serine/threonine protein kinase
MYEEDLVKRGEKKSKAKVFAARRIRDEIDTLIDLSVTHPSKYIVKYYDSFEDENYWFIIMENITGMKLDDF